MDAICRFIHGDEFADRIGIRPNALSTIIPVYVEANHRQGERERADPDLLHWKMKETLRAFDAADRNDGTWAVSIAVPGSMVSH